MDPIEFEGIEGLTIVPGSSRPNRLLVSYVFANPRTPREKTAVMVRITLRNWIGTAMGDMHIDTYCVRKNIAPEWADVGFPANDSRNLRLTYPPPRQFAQYSSRLVQSGGLQARPPPQEHNSGMEEFEKLVELFIKGHEEAREERKQQREIMSRLLLAL